MVRRDNMVINRAELTFFTVELLLKKYITLGPGMVHISTVYTTGFARHGATCNLGGGQLTAMEWHVEIQIRVTRPFNTHTPSIIARRRARKER